MSKMQTFNEFVYKQTREAKKHLGIIKKLLEQNNFKVKDFTKNADEPYLYVYVPEHNLSFKGIRLYEIGGDIAFRPQKNPENQAYGIAHSLAVNELFEDLMDEDIDDKKIAHVLIKAIVDKINNFFEMCKKTEKDRVIGIDPLNRSYMRSNGTDYASLVTSNI